MCTTSDIFVPTNHDFSGTSLLRSPVGLSKNDLAGEVTVLPGIKVLLFALLKIIWY